MQYQTYDGIQFYQTEPDDYFRHSIKGTTILMHRYVWEKENMCKIPRGYHIHHKDGNKSNNNISNLILMKGIDHWTLHGKLLTEEEKAWRKWNLDNNARPKAVEWHKSEEGKEWHSKQSKEMWENGVFSKTYICDQCGKEYTTNNIKKVGNHFCSNACRSAYRRAQGRDLVDRECPMCHKMFRINKYKKQECCSKECSKTLYWLRKEGK